MKSIAFIIVPGILILITALILKLWWWLGFFTSVFIILGLFEVLSYKFQNKTLSRRFWELESKIKWIFLTAIGLFFIALIAHLASG